MPFARRISLNPVPPNPLAWLRGGRNKSRSPGAAADLPAVEHAGIGRIELAIVRGVALGDVHDENAFGPRLAHKLDDTVEHAGLLVVFGELAVPGAVRRNEIGLEVDQQDGGLVCLDAFGGRWHRLRLRPRNEREQRENARQYVQDMSHCHPPVKSPARWLLRARRARCYAASRRCPEIAAHPIIRGIGRCGNTKATSAAVSLPVPSMRITA